jgi:hypothetical protein
MLLQFYRGCVQAVGGEAEVARALQLWGLLGAPAAGPLSLATKV